MQPWAKKWTCIKFSNPLKFVSNFLQKYVELRYFLTCFVWFLTKGKISAEETFIGGMMLWFLWDARTLVFVLNLPSLANFRTSQRNQNIICLIQVSFTSSVKMNLNLLTFSNLVDDQVEPIQHYNHFYGPVPSSLRMCCIEYH